MFPERQDDRSEPRKERSEEEKGERERKYKKLKHFKILNNPSLGCKPLRNAKN